MDHPILSKINQHPSLNTVAVRIAAALAVLGVMWAAQAWGQAINSNDLPSMRNRPRIQNELMEGAQNESFQSGVNNSFNEVNRQTFLNLGNCILNSSAHGQPRRTCDSTQMNRACDLHMQSTLGSSTQSPFQTLFRDREFKVIDNRCRSLCARKGDQQPTCRSYQIALNTRQNEQRNRGISAAYSNSSVATVSNSELHFCRDILNPSAISSNLDEAMRRQHPNEVPNLNSPTQNSRPALYCKIEVPTHGS